jgi:hypothetical protein
MRHDPRDENRINFTAVIEQSTSCAVIKPNLEQISKEERIPSSSHDTVPFPS